MLCVLRVRFRDSSGSQTPGDAQGKRFEAHRGIPGHRFVKQRGRKFYRGVLAKTNSPGRNAKMLVIWSNLVFDNSLRF